MTLLETSSEAPITGVLKHNYKLLPETVGKLSELKGKKSSEAPASYPYLINYYYVVVILGKVCIYIYTCACVYVARARVAGTVPKPLTFKKFFQ